MEEIIRPKFESTNTESHSDSDSVDDGVCKKCGGYGRILYTPDAREFEWLYGVSGLEPQPFVKDCPDCKGIATKYDTEDLTGVPSLMRDADITKFDFTKYSRDMTSLEKICESFVKEFADKWEKMGKGLYLWSKTPGSGKTFLACCLGKSVMCKQRLRMKFISVPDYIEKVSEGYSIKKNGGFDDPSKIYRECDLLIFDDIGAQLGKEWQQTEIFRLVDERQKTGKVTIYTSNLHFEDLNVDERVKSRIQKTTICIQMPEESIRKKIANTEQEEFLKGIL